MPKLELKVRRRRSLVSSFYLQVNFTLKFPHEKDRATFHEHD